MAEFIKEYPQHVAEDNAMAFLSEDGGETYNKCHCKFGRNPCVTVLTAVWSNFEIGMPPTYPNAKLANDPGDLNFWRSQQYMDFFEYLDKAGGFYYERWGDAPVHSIGAALFAKKDQIKFFDDIGYRHEPFQHCPQGDAHTRGNCWCDPNNNFDFEWYSCTNKYLAMWK